jgi:hypothetical protein
LSAVYKTAFIWKWSTLPLAQMPSALAKLNYYTFCSVPRSKSAALEDLVGSFSHSRVATLLISSRQKQDMHFSQEFNRVQLKLPAAKVCAICSQRAAFY